MMVTKLYILRSLDKKIQKTVFVFCLIFIITIGCVGCANTNQTIQNKTMRSSKSVNSDTAFADKEVSFENAAQFEDSELETIQTSIRDHLNNADNHRALYDKSFFVYHDRDNTEIGYIRGKTTVLEYIIPADHPADATLYHTTLTKNSFFQNVSKGMGVFSVQQTDTGGDYRFLSSGVDLKYTKHITTDGYVIEIEYDQNWDVQRMREIHLDRKSFSDALQTE